MAEPPPDPNAVLQVEETAKGVCQQLPGPDGSSEVFIFSLDLCNLSHVSGM